MCVCVHVSVRVCMSTVSMEPEREWDSLKLELQMVVNQELNLGPVDQQQQVLLSEHLSSHPSLLFFFFFFKIQSLVEPGTY